MQDATDNLQEVCQSRLSLLGCESIGGVVFQKPLRKVIFAFVVPKEDYSRGWFVSVSLYRSRLFGRKGSPFASVARP